jgi:hypothetical protein
MAQTINETDWVELGKADRCREEAGDWVELGRGEQPREPAGSPEGGQFASTDGGAGSSESESGGDDSGGGGKLPTPSAAWEDRVAEKAAKEHAAFAAAHGLSLEEYTAQANAHVATLVKDAEVRVRISPTNLGRVLEDGRFKTQFETGKSGGLLDNSRRSNFERHVLGVPSETAPQDRPIYAYFYDSYDDAPDAKWMPATYQYGQAKVVLKDTIKSRATLTSYDSLDGTLAGSSHEANFAPRPMLKPDVRAFAAHRDVLGKPLHEVVSGYGEVQVHGGVKVSDIARVEFNGKTVNKTLTKKLDKLGIPWKHAMAEGLAE